VGAVANYQAALAVSPANPAAEHYLVHAFESIGVNGNTRYRLLARFGRAGLTAAGFY